MLRIHDDAVGWYPFVLTWNGTRRDDPLAELVLVHAKDRQVPVWALGALAKNLHVNIVACAIRVRGLQANPRRRDGAPGDAELRAVIDTIRARAQDSEIVDLAPLRTEADRLAARLTWPSHFLRRWPADPLNQARTRLNVALWAFDELRRAAESLGATWPASTYDALVPESAAAETVPLDRRAIERRIRTIKQQIAAPEALLAAVLAEVMTFGPYGPTGAPRS